MSENQNTEYKQNWHDDHLKWICGFANADGGNLTIGVKDNGSVSGIENHKYLMDEIPSKIRNLLGITANVNLKYIEQKYCIEIVVPSYTVPISLRGRYYYRTGSTNTELTGNSLNEFLLRKYGKSWDDVSLESSSIEQIDIKTIDLFKQLALDRLPSITAENDLVTILKKLNLIEHGKLKRAAILLFGSEPQKLFIHAHIRIGKFISDSDIVSSDIVTGNLFQQIEQTLSILKTKYLSSIIAYEGIHRREKLEYPLNALREAILNALIHRNYLSTASTQIRVYNNKLLIINDGELPKEISLADLKTSHLSRPRNPLLADIFSKRALLRVGDGAL